MKYYSQYGQDRFLDEKIFKGKTDGVFVEVGADDGITHSNTYFFEKYRNWSGICIEPRRRSFDQLVKNRKAICENCCITNVQAVKLAKFVEIDGHGGQLSGLLDKYDKRHLDRVKSVVGEDGVSKRTVDMNCENLSALVLRHGLKHIDYCSVDTEGGELEVLQSVDFKQIEIDIISVENNFKTGRVRKFLKKNGYRKIAKIFIDDIYARPGTPNYNYIYTMDYVRDCLAGVRSYFFRVVNFIVRKLKQSLSEETRLYLKSRLVKGYRNQYVELKRLVQAVGVDAPVLIDGGAHEGQTILKFRRYFPQSEIYAFEAIPELANRLKISEDPKVTVFGKALGEKNGEIEFCVNETSATSSIFKPDLVRQYYPGVAEPVEKLLVTMTSLDNLLHQQEIKQPDIIKLDLQGYELNALRGAKTVLEKAKVVLAEVEFVSLYKDQPLFGDVEKFMRENRYTLYNFFDIESDKAGQIIFADAIFLNDRFFKNKQP